MESIVVLNTCSFNTQGQHLLNIEDYNRNIAVYYFKGV